MKKIKLSRDSLFNISAVSLSFALSLTSSIFDLKLFGDIAPLVIFFTLSAFNKVTFKNKKFFNSQNIDISNNLPNKFAEWTLVVFLIAFIFIATNLLKLERGALASIFTITISYFALNNCPMSILLNEEAWQQKERVFGIKPVPTNCQKSDFLQVSSTTFTSNTHSMPSSINTSNTLTDSLYSSLSSNIHYRK